LALVDTLTLIGIERARSKKVKVKKVAGTLIVSESEE